MENYTENLHEVLPAAIAEADRWLLWKSVANNGSKPRKVPFYADGSPRNGALDTDQDRGRLVGLEDAITAYRANPGVYTGLGFALGPDGTGECWQGVDLDDIDEHNLGHLALPGYVERSPSGKGLHAIGLGMEFRGLGSNGSGVEAYSRGRYFTMTGDVVQADEPIDLAPFVSGVLEKLHALHREEQEQAAADEVIDKRTARNLRSALLFLRADDHGLWIKVGQCLCGLGDVGRGLWLEWSSTSEKFDAANAARTWETLTGDRAGWRGVFAEAQRQGWTHPGYEEPPAQEKEQKAEQWPPPLESLIATDEEIATARLSPRCIVDRYLYADVAQIIAPGGSGKTTALLHESIHIALGLDVWGMRVESPGRTLFITKEDQREQLLARYREICTALELSDEQERKAREGVVFLDVTGMDLKLLLVDNGNIGRTVFAKRICDAYRHAPPAVVVFDPLISFGAAESMVNDNEDALVQVGRYIVKELDCCVRYVHHTGQEAARNAKPDQYSGRGGTALADGARMVSLLFPKNDNDKPPEGCHEGEGVSILKLQRPKISYAPPNLPTIWIRREGFSYSCFYELRRTPEQDARAKTDQVERFLISRLAQGERYNKTTLRHSSSLLDMTERQVIAALSMLQAQGRVVDAQLPEEHTQGRRQTYLHPVGAG